MWLLPRNLVNCFFKDIEDGAFLAMKKLETL